MALPPPEALLAELETISPTTVYGRVAAVSGFMVEVAGAARHLSVGSLCRVQARGGRQVPAEVVGFRQGRALLLPFGALEGVGLGCRAEIVERPLAIAPDRSWLGRVVDALGQPVDGGPPLRPGPREIPIRNAPPNPHRRQRLGPRLDLGVRAMDTFLCTCQGQRMGIFAGSGVGKSVLMSMLARYATADVAVIGLVGERGREVQEFLEDTLGPEGLARAVVVVATSDEPPLMRRQAAYLTLAIAEAFRNDGAQVLCMIDSVTRFAMAQREIGLSAGEPPTAKGYPPTTFTELARLLERAGPGEVGQGSITGLFTVLVEGDDHNEPVADAVRGILDGHIVMERRIAERGRYPAINLLRSVSRSMPGCNTADEIALIRRARAALSTFEDMAELIRLGAYRAGSDPKVDEAIRLYPKLESFLAQGKGDPTPMVESFARLAEIVGG